jgi:hypothetical protein
MAEVQLTPTLEIVEEAEIVPGRTKSGVQKRIDQLTRRNKEKDAAIEALRQENTQALSLIARFTRIAQRYEEKLNRREQHGR